MIFVDREQLAAFRRLCVEYGEARARLADAAPGDPARHRHFMECGRLWGEIERDENIICKRRKLNIEYR